jgi:putative ABC transport system substrate-binding protein
VSPFVNKTLRGVRRADLPVAQPTMFELVVNMKRTIAVGNKIAAVTFISADKVIESWA